jgi:hypothetical protein
MQWKHGDLLGIHIDKDLLAMTPCLPVKTHAKVAKVANVTIS